MTKFCLFNYHICLVKQVLTNNGWCCQIDPRRLGPKLNPESFTKNCKRQWHKRLTQFYLFFNFYFSCLCHP